jgi:hypothetical protein
MRDNKGRYARIDDETNESSSRNNFKEIEIPRAVDKPLTIKMVIVLIILMWILSSLSPIIHFEINSKMKSYYCSEWIINDTATIFVPPKRKEG